jgi:hypothetical protein
VCAGLAAVLDGTEPEPEVDAPAREASDDLRAASSVLERMVLYVDRQGR